jgi:hypothetical protein
MACVLEVRFMGLSRREFSRLGAMGLAAPRPGSLRAAPCRPILMHEHINYFSEQSLTTLMHSCGCAVTEVGSYVMDSGVEKAQMVWCLGTVT